MVVTVKEAKEKMEELQEEYDEFLKLHNYTLCLDLNKSGESTYADSPEKDARRKVLETIKKESKTNYDIRSLCSIACNCALLYSIKPYLLIKYHYSILISTHFKITMRNIIYYAR